MIRIDFAIVPVLLLIVVFFASRYFGKMEVKVTAWEEGKKGGTETVKFTGSLRTAGILLSELKKSSKGAALKNGGYRR